MSSRRFSLLHSVRHPRLDWLSVALMVLALLVLGTSLLLRNLSLIHI